MFSIVALFTHIINIYIILCSNNDTGNSFDKSTNRSSKTMKNLNKIGKEIVKIGDNDDNTSTVSSIINNKDITTKIKELITTPTLLYELLNKSGVPMFTKIYSTTSKKENKKISYKEFILSSVLEGGKSINFDTQTVTTIQNLSTNESVTSLLIYKEKKINIPSIIIIASVVIFLLVGLFGIFKIKSKRIREGSDGSNESKGRKIFIFHCE